MYLIVGLGNPGTEYEKTFHNMGYLAIANAAEELGVKFKKKECESMVAEAYVGGEKVILARPLTFMNNSGRAVKQLMAKYKINREHLLVIYDDYDLPKGTLRIRASGSAGTHNGMRSVLAEIGFSDFARIRVGIRDAEVNIPIIHYVLAQIKREDYELFDSALRKAGKAAASFASGKSIEEVMNEFNGK